MSGLRTLDITAAALTDSRDHRVSALCGWTRAANLPAYDPAAGLGANFEPT
jgi:hypothetical protein